MGIRLEPRYSTPLWLNLLAPVGSIATALFLSATLILWSGAPLLTSFQSLFAGAFGSLFALTETLARATPLILTGLGVAVAFRAKLWNIGAEGQFYLGALMTVLLGTGWLPLPPVLLIPGLMAAGALAGGLLLLIPAWLKTRFQVDEVVTTLLLNFIVLLLVSYLLEGPIKDPLALGWPQSSSLIDSAALPKLLERTRLHGGLVLAILGSVLVWLLNDFTVWGYEMKAVGSGSQAARFAGIPVQAVILRTALLSGGLAGLAGVSEVAGLKGYLTLDLSPGFGYSGIVVAMLAQLHPLGVIVSAIFVAGVYVGADTMSRAMNVPSYLADVVVALSLLCMLVGTFLTRYRIRL